MTTSVEARIGGLSCAAVMSAVTHASGRVQARSAASLCGTIRSGGGGSGGWLAFQFLGCPLAGTSPFLSFLSFFPLPFPSSLFRRRPAGGSSGRLRRCEETLANHHGDGETRAPQAGQGLAVEMNPQLCSGTIGGLNVQMSESRARVATLEAFGTLDRSRSGGEPSKTKRPGCLAS